jgi:hypothetical protein
MELMQLGGFDLEMEMEIGIEIEDVVVVVVGQRKEEIMCVL